MNIEEFWSGYTSSEQEWRRDALQLQGPERKREDPGQPCNTKESGEHRAVLSLDDLRRQDP